MSGQTSDSDSNSSIWGLRGLDDLSSSSSDGRAGSPINETAPVEVAPPTGTTRREDLLRQLEGLQQAMYHNQEMQKALRLAEQSCSCTGSSQYAPAYSEAQVLLNEIPVGVQPVQQQQLEKVQMLPMQFNHGGWVPSAIASQEVAEAPKKKAILQPQTPDKPFYNEYGVDLMKLTDVELEKVQSWSMKERQFCCSQFGVGCPDLKCLSGRDDWQHAWSPGKKIWCCQHHHVGCDPRDAPKEVQVVEVPVPVPAPPKPPASPTPAPSAKVTEHHGFWRPMEPKATAKASATKAHAETVPLVAAGPGRPAGAPALANALRNNDATPEPFQCTGESKGWTEKRQEWCCWHYGTGCPR